MYIYFTTTRTHMYILALFHVYVLIFLYYIFLVCSAFHWKCKMTCLFYLLTTKDPDKTVVHRPSFVLSYYVSLRSLVPCCDARNDFRIKTMFDSSQSSCIIYVICVCLRIAVSNTYCVEFLLCLSSSCVPYFPLVIYTSRSFPHS